MAGRESGGSRATKRNRSTPAMRGAIKLLDRECPGSEVPTINCPTRGTIAYQRCSEFQRSCKCRCPVAATATSGNRVVLSALRTIVVESTGADPIMCRVCGEVEVARPSARCLDCRGILRKGRSLL